MEPAPKSAGGLPVADMFQQIFHRDALDLRDEELYPSKIYAQTARSFLKSTKEPEGKVKSQAKSFIMEEFIKPVVPNPSPSMYNTAPSWPKRSDKRGSGKESKYTYIDRIVVESKERPTPSPFEYHVVPNNKERGQKLKAMQREGKRHKYEPKFTYVTGILKGATDFPGPGCCNPHLGLRKIKRVARDTPDTWKDRHSKQAKALKTRKFSPTCTSYTPFNPGIGLFAPLHKIPKTVKAASKDKQKSFGTDSRFEYTRPRKSKSVGPGGPVYNLVATWGVEKGRGRNWQERVYKGQNSSESPTMSIYRS